MNELVRSAGRIVAALLAFHILTTAFEGLGYSYGYSAMGAVALILGGMFVYYYQLDKAQTDT